MATKSDYGVTFGSTAYDTKWTSCEVEETFGSPATFCVMLEGTTTTDFSTIALGADFKLYQYDSAGAGTLRFLGIVNSVTRISYNQIKVSGFDYGGKLMNTNVVPNMVATIKTFESSETATLGTIVNQLCSTNLDGSSPWIVSVGTVNDDTTKIGKFTIPMISRWEALSMLAKRARKEIYINPTTGTFNMVTSRGSSTSAATYYLTGSSTNAYLGTHEYTYNNIANDVIGIGVGKDLHARYQDISTTFCKLATGDTRVAIAFSIAADTPSSITVKSTDGFPASGRIALKGVRTTLATLGTNIYGDYTGKTDTTFTGITWGLGALNGKVQVGVPVLGATSVIVDSNSSFASSGSLVIGEELIDYSAKPDSATFTVSRVLDQYRYSRDYTTANGAHTASATTISVVSSSGFPTTGILKITPTSAGNQISEYVSYSGVSGNDFTGCIRGYDGTTPIAIPTSSAVVLYANERIHPKNVLVYKYVATPDANSSIGTKGRYTRVVRFERAMTVEQIEAETSRYLEIHKWGDQNASFATHKVFDYGSVNLGDKITVTDSTLSWSSYEVRTLGKKLGLNKYGSYELTYRVATYSDTPTEGNLNQDDHDFIMQMTGAKEGTVAISGKDTDVKAGSELASTGGINSVFQHPSGCGLFSNDLASGYVFTNYLWIDDSYGSANVNPFSCYDVVIDSSGLFLPMQKADPDPTGVEGAIYYNTTSNTLRWYDGAAWADIGSGISDYWVRDTDYLYPETSTDTLGDASHLINQVYAVDVLCASLWMSYSGTHYAPLAMGSSSTITVNYTMLPVDDDTINLGSISKRWSFIFADNADFGSTAAYWDITYESSSIIVAGAYGSSTNIDIKFIPKGTGVVKVTASILPNADESYDLGSSSYEWDDLFVKKVYLNTGSAARFRLPVGTNMYG